ncbi:MAG: TolB family protein [Anaerolineae bacterium]
MWRFLFLGVLCLTMIGGTVGCAGKPVPTVIPMASPPPTEVVFSSPLVRPIPSIVDLILFISFRDGYPSIYGVSPDGTTVFRVLELPKSSQVVGHLDWSAARKQIAFALVQETRSDVYTADLTSSALVNVTAGTPSGGVEPRWSPDGTRLAYVCGEYEPDICVIGAEGSGYAQLTFHPSRDINPSWSPDGSAIAYQTSRGGLSDIYVLNLKDLTERDLTQGVSQNAQPSWSPDGKAILFQSDRDGSMDIFVISAEGDQITNLTNNGALDVDPQWSPDGEFIAFRSDRDGEWDLFVMRRDGSDLTNLTAGWGPVFTYTWSPDGRYLAFASGHAGNTNIYKVNIENGKVVRLTHHDAEDMAPLWISLE